MDILADTEHNKLLRRMYRTKNTAEYEKTMKLYPYLTNDYLSNLGEFLMFEETKTKTNKDYINPNSYCYGCDKPISGKYPHISSMTHEVVSNMRGIYYQNSNQNYCTYCDKYLTNLKNHCTCKTHKTNIKSVVFDALKHTKMNYDCLNNIISYM